MCNIRVFCHQPKKKRLSVRNRSATTIKSSSINMDCDHEKASVLKAHLKSKAIPHAFYNKNR